LLQKVIGNTLEVVGVLHARAIVSSLFITIAVYVYNDVIDLDMDKESISSNKLDRALVTGEVSAQTAKMIVILGSAIGIITAWFINLTVFGITLLWYGLFMMYSFPAIRLKRIFVVKTQTTSLGIALALLIGTSSVSGGLYSLGLFVAFMQWTFISLMLPGLSDSFDLDEDRKYGMKTLAMAKLENQGADDDVRHLLRFGDVLCSILLIQP
jgi:4-hydroxybenzoate polyprenyltransferase